jgi:cell division protein FtsZ
MTLNLNVPTLKEQLTPKITVIGVGGAGGNAVNNMIQNNLEGVEFLVTNTDSQALAQTLSERSIQLGRSITQGLGAGSRPDIGRAAAEEALDEILSELEGSNMIFVTAGMGGGTGTGAAPVIARAAREAGILTVGVVTKPFHFEGVHRMRLAEAGMNELQQYVDTLIIIPNQNLFRVANEKTTFADAFKMADDVLDSGVRGVTDLMVMPGLINLDFADIRAVMTEMGKAMMGTGEAEGENRAIDAAEAAISNPLLDDVSMKGARGVLINITGGSDMTLFEVDEAANRIRDEVDPEANIIFGSTFVQDVEGRMRVSVVATGIDADQIEAPRPITLSLVSDRDEAATAAEPAPAAEQTAAPMTAGASAMEAGALALDTAAVARHAPAAEPQEPGLAPRQETVAEPAPAQQPAPVAQQQEIEQRIATSAAAEWAPAAGASDEGFFAPPPVQAETRKPLVADSSARPNPFAEAELANSSRERSDETRASVGLGRRKAQSFFARMSGAARAIQGVAQASESAASESRSPQQEAPSHAAPAADTVSQPKLLGLEASEGIGSNAAEEELLDIPAFLRRQAN